MRRALTRAFGAALLVLAVAVPRLGHAADGRPVVRVVLAASGDGPPWFDGFVKHLERELGLRGIEVAVARSERDAGSRRNGAGPASNAAADAELVVEAPSALHPVLRFSVAPRDQALPPEGGHVRQVNLTAVPADGCALALAAAADELMRSNWPRAVPSEASRSATVEEKAVSGPGDGTTPAVANASGDARAPATQADRAVASPTAPSAAGSEAQTSAVEAEPRAASPATNAPRWEVGFGVAAEAFAGGQSQIGPDLRWGMRVLPRLGVEVRGGWRRVLRHEATNGVIAGDVIVAGGALKVEVLGGARVSLSFVGRADLLRVAYSGEGRDATIVVTNGSGIGLVVGAGPRGRIALTRVVGIEGELLAGASPMATTATDTYSAVLSTNGAALMGSLGLSLGL